MTQYDRRVLIIEDDETWAAIVRRQVDQLGATAIVSVHVGQAMVHIEQYRPDVIILDMLLLGETGVTLLNELRSHSDLRRIPVIVLSSALDDSTTRALEAYAVRAVFDKTTVTPIQLKSAIGRALEEAVDGRD